MAESASKERLSTPEERLAMLRGLNGAKQTAEPDVRANAHDGKVSVLGRTLRFKGELTAEEDLVIQGCIEGSIRHSQSLTVGADGSVIGDVRARIIVIEGTVEGDLYGAESVSVRATGKVRGSIFSPTVGLAEGSTFNGKIDMDVGESSPAQSRSKINHSAAAQAPSGDVLNDSVVDEILDP